MRIVFELEGDAQNRAYVVDVVKVDSRKLSGLIKGGKRDFPLCDVRNATTISGQPFSLRPFDVTKTPHI